MFIKVNDLEKIRGREEARHQLAEGHALPLDVAVSLRDDPDHGWSTQDYWEGYCEGLGQANPYQRINVGVVPKWGVSPGLLIWAAVVALVCWAFGVGK